MARRPAKVPKEDYDSVKALHEKIMGDAGSDDIGASLSKTPDEMAAELRQALRDGLISTEALADEVMTNILLGGVNDGDRLRAAEMIKKAADARRGQDQGIPPSEEDLERFQRVLIETGTIREAIEERREISASPSATVS